MWLRLIHRVAGIACLILGSVQPGQTAGFLYDCDMTDLEQGRGWVSPKIAIVLPEEGGVRVVDALTLTFAEEPVSATVLRDTDTRLIVKWTLENVKADTGRSFAYFDYRASIAKNSGQIELTASPRSFDTGLRSSGTCRKRSQ